MPLTRDQLQRSAEAEFAALEDAAKRASPGVMDLLAVYGGYEAAVAEAGRYLGSEVIAPTYSTTDSSER